MDFIERINSIFEADDKPTEKNTEDEKYSHTGGGTYVKKGQEDKEGADKFRKDDGGKYKKLTPEEAAAKDGGGEKPKEKPAEKKPAEKKPAEKKPAEKSVFDKKPAAKKPAANTGDSVSSDEHSKNIEKFKAGIGGDMDWSLATSENEFDNSDGTFEENYAKEVLQRKAMSLRQLEGKLFINENVFDNDKGITLDVNHIIRKSDHKWENLPDEISKEVESLAIEKAILRSNKQTMEQHMSESKAWATSMIGAVTRASEQERWNTDSDFKEAHSANLKKAMAEYKGHYDAHSEITTKYEENAKQLNQKLVDVFTNTKMNDAGKFEYQGEHDKTKHAMNQAQDALKQAQDAISSMSGDGEVSKDVPEGVDKGFKDKPGKKKFDPNTEMVFWFEDGEIRAAPADDPDAIEAVKDQELIKKLGKFE